MVMSDETWQLKKINENLEEIAAHLKKLNETQLANNSHLLKLSNCVIPDYFGEKYPHANALRVEN